MKIIINSNKKTIRLSKKDWILIGQKANWIKISRKIRGEYWYDGSTLVYCDGDVCDSNHEIIVINDILSSHDLLDENIDVTTIMDIILTLGAYSDYNVNEESESAIRSYCENYNMEYEDIIRILNKGMELTDEETLCLLGKEDPRVYGLKHLGWIRIKGNDFETYKLDAEQFKNIKDALDEICEQEGIEWDVEKDFYINIEVISTRKYYQEIPVSVVYEQNLSSIQLY